jgi:hypothetical protein
MRPLIWICIAPYLLAMAGVSYAAHRIVGSFGVVGGLVTIAAMYVAALYWEQRREHRLVWKPFTWPVVTRWFLSIYPKRSRENRADIT